MKQKILFIIIFFSTLCFSIQQSAYAEEKVSLKPVDLRVLIDVSGSMKKNDPSNLRVPAIKLLVNLIPTDSRAGVWLFSEQTKELIPLNKVDEKWRKKGMQKSNAMHSNGRYTNIKEAILHVSDDWLHKPEGEYQRVIILLTDGYVDVSQDQNENEMSRLSIIGEVLPDLVKNNITVYTIALSSNADKKLLDLLSTDTNGISKSISNNEQLEKAFFEIFQSSVKRSTTPFHGNKIKVDKSIKELTLLVFGENDEIKIKSPSEKIITMKNAPSNIRWHHEKKYNLITIVNPEEGIWQIEGAGKDKHVMIVSDLDLQTTILPYHVFLNESLPIEVFLTNKGKLIQDQDFLNNFNFTIDEISPSGVSNKWNLTASDENLCKYQHNLKILQNPGIYKIELAATSKTVARVQRQVITVHDSPINIETNKAQKLNDETTIKITPDENLVQAHTLKYEVKLFKVDDVLKNETIMPPTTDQILNFKTTHSGDLQYIVMVEGQMRNNRFFTFKSQPIMVKIDKSITENSHPNVIEQEPKKEILAMKNGINKALEASRQNNVKVHIGLTDIIVSASVVIILFVLLLLTVILIKKKRNNITESLKDIL